MGVSVTGFQALIDGMSGSYDRLERGTYRTAMQLSEDVAALAQERAPIRDGQLRSSIKPYTERHGAVIEGGARTSYDVAIYHEFGTGPVGEGSPHPEAAALDITYNPQGWRYQSAQVAAERGEEYIPKKKGGWVYTEGVPAQAMMYRAITELEGKISAALEGVIEEAVIR